MMCFARYLENTLANVNIKRNRELIMDNVNLLFEK